MTCLSFPAVGHSMLEPRPWDWKKRVLVSGMMDAELMRRIVSKVAVRGPRPQPVERRRLASAQESQRRPGPCAVEGSHPAAS